MTRDMQRAGLAPRTIGEYIAAIRHMVEFLGRAPDLLSPGHIRTWDDELYRRGHGPDWIRIHHAALSFLYRRTLSRPEMVSFLVSRRSPRRLPNVLEKEQVFQVLAAIREPRLRMFFSLIFNTGLRLSEAADLKASDIDRPRGVIHVRHGKGGKERLVKLGDGLYQQLRTYWHEVRAVGPHPEPLSGASLLFVSRRGTRIAFPAARHALALAAQAVGIMRRVLPHTLRHSYATGQLEAGTELPVLQARSGTTAWPRPSSTRMSPPA
jgi:site-specific recombinase XerD